MTDHRIGLTLHKIDRVMLGEFDELIDALIAEDEAARLAAEGECSAGAAWTASCADPAGTVGAFLCRAGQHLRAAAIDSPRLDARLLLGPCHGRRNEDLLRDPRAAGAARGGARFSPACCGAGWTHAPVAHLLGTQEFWSLPFAVSPATLIPRARFGNPGRGGAGAFPDRAAVAPGARSRHRHRLPAAGGALGIPRRHRARGGPGAGGGGAGAGECGAARPGRPRRVPRGGLGGTGRWPFRPGAVQPALYRKRAPSPA